MFIRNHFSFLSLLPGLSNLTSYQIQQKFLQTVIKWAPKVPTDHPFPQGSQRRCPGQPLREGGRWNPAQSAQCLVRMGTPHISPSAGIGNSQRNTSRKGEGTSRSLNKQRSEREKECCHKVESAERAGNEYEAMDLVQAELVLPLCTGADRFANSKAVKCCSHVHIRRYIFSNPS